MPPGLLDDPDALTLILQKLRVENDLTTSLRRLCNFRAVNQYALEYLSAHNAELARDLLGVDMGMSPLALTTMISRMTPTHRANLVTLAEQWNTPHAIQDRYFMNCTALAIKTLSSFVTAIGESAFERCASLRVAEWDAPLLTAVHRFAFCGCAKLTLKTWTTPVLNVVNTYAFFDCKTLVLSEWSSPVLTTIEDRAFKDCTDLTLANWNAPKLSSIGDAAFAGCSRLGLLEWHAPLLTIVGYNAFVRCTSLVLPNGLEGDLTKMVIGNAAFCGCTKLSELARSQIMEINPNALDPV